MANIWDYTGGFRNVVRSCEDGVSTCKVAHVRLQVVLQLRNTLRNFRNERLILQLILQLRNFRTAWSGCLQMAITSSFQLQFAHRLKCWTSDFPSFEMTYSVHEMDSKKCSKCVEEFLSSWILHVRFLCFSSLHSWLALAKNYEAPKLGFFM